MEMENDTIGQTGEVKVANSHYFSVSTNKLIIMSICTFGIYEIYWFYKNWKHIKEVESSKIMPFWRAIFAPLWIYYLYKDIKEKSDTMNLNAELSPGVLAIIYLALSVAAKMPDPYWLISLISFTVLIPANNILTMINHRAVENFQQNESFKGWNWLALTLGTLLVIVAINQTFVDAGWILNF